MRVIDPGHIYMVANFESDSQLIQFIKKEKDAEGNLTTVYDGTTNEELIEVLMDRLAYLNGKMHHDSNISAIGHLGHALGYLRSRTEDRKRRGVEGTPLP